jgi:tetratricopeptide (TPR) repeat protein
MLLQFLRFAFAVLFTILFLLTGDWNILRAQERPGVLSPSATMKPADPPVPKRANLSASNRSTNVSLDGKKFLEFKKAITDGNNARKKSDYETAFRAYLNASQLFPNDASSYYGLGNVYFDLSCYHSAIDFYSQAAKLKPNYFDALMQLGFAYSNKEQYDNAEAQFEAASRVNPKSIAPKLARFYVLAKKGKSQEAMDGINKLINERTTTNKDRAAAYLTLGDVYVAQKRWQESIEPFQKATQLNPEPADAFLRLGISQLVTAFLKTPYSIDITMEDKAQLTASARQASETLRTAVEVKHFEHPNGYLVLGMALTYQSNYQDAKSKLNAYLSKVRESEKQLLSLDSNLTQKCDYAFGRLYADGYIQLGAVYESEARDAGARKDELLNEAIKQYKNAVAAQQDHPGSYSSLGNVYIAQGKFREAGEEYEKALLYESTDMKAGTYSVLGTVYAKLRSDTKAIDYLNKAIAIAPTPSNFKSLAMVYQNQENYDEAIRLGIKANELEKTPKATSYYGLALSYFLRAQTNNKDADYEEAIRLLNEAIKINKSFAELYLALGNVYKFYKNGAHLDLALANYNKAKDYDPQNAAIYFHLGDVHSSITHNYDAAIKYLTEAIRLKPDYALAHWTLALAYREKKDDAAAIKQFLEGLKYEKSLNAYVLLSDIYDRQKNYAEAIKTLQEAVRLDPESHSAYLHLARVYTHQQNNDEAIRFYDHAISRLKPDDAGNRDLYRCRIVRLQRHYTEALGCFQKLVYPLSDQAPYEIGATYVVMGNKQAALAQHLQLTQLKSPLAEELMKQINEMKTDR